jgi:hypothetical protein
MGKGRFGGVIEALLLVSSYDLMLQESEDFG